MPASANGDTGAAPSCVQNAAELEPRLGLELEPACASFLAAAARLERGLRSAAVGGGAAAMAAAASLGLVAAAAAAAAEDTADRISSPRRSSAEDRRRRGERSLRSASGAPQQRTQRGGRTTPIAPSSQRTLRVLSSRQDTEGLQAKQLAGHGARASQTTTTNHGKYNANCPL